MKNKIKNIYDKFIKILKRPEMQILPGQLAFYILMSFIPILAICSIVASSLINNFDIASEIRNLMPDALADILLQLLKTDVSDTNIIILLIGYLLVASKGTSSIINISNRLYKVQERDFLRDKVKSIVMTIIIVLLFIFMLFIPILGDEIIKFIFKLLGSPVALYNYVWVYKFLKIVVSFLFVYFTIKLLYTLAPNSKIKSSTTTYGAVFTTIGWIIVTEIFAFYITEIARYNLLYGNFANILILLIWVNLLASLFVIGMVINLNYYEKEEIEKELEEEKVEELEVK